VNSRQVPIINLRLDTDEKNVLHFNRIRSDELNGRECHDQEVEKGELHIASEGVVLVRSAI
jgi:hypothetical protein